jgi:hypothetical protein
VSAQVPAQMLVPVQVQPLALMELERSHPLHPLQIGLWPVQPPLFHLLKPTIQSKYRPLGRELRYQLCPLRFPPVAHQPLLFHRVGLQIS